jgi:hypothetical protein
LAPPGRTSDESAAAGRAGRERSGAAGFEAAGEVATGLLAGVATATGTASADGAAEALSWSARAGLAAAEEGSGRSLGARLEAGVAAEGDVGAATEWPVASLPRRAAGSEVRGVSCDTRGGWKSTGKGTGVGTGSADDGARLEAAE